MDQLPSFGTNIAKSAPPTFKTYAPLIKANASNIQTTKRKSFEYGTHERQALDVYYPSSESKVSSNDSPILVFLYGGGLVRGAKTIPEYADGLVHANIGHFFATRGYVTVIPDYRLIGHGAKFPSGGEDLALTVEWIGKNLVTESQQTRDLFLMGNSAGGIHMSTFLFAPVFAEAIEKLINPGSKTSLNLKAAVFLSVPFQFEQADEYRLEVLKGYFGDMQANCPLGLLRAAKPRLNGDPLPGVKALVLNGTLDPEDEIMLPRKDFIEEWISEDWTSGASLLSTDMMEGQNHISPPLSLGTGVQAEEAWGNQVDKFLKSARS